MPWTGWPFERVALLFVGLAFVMLTIQVTLYHLGGAFHRWQMWAPVLYGPVLAIVGTGASAVMSPSIRTAVMVLFGIGILDGLAGTYHHLNAIRHYVMGFTLRNYIAGPPPVLPPVFAALSAFGLLAVYWAAHV